MKKGDVFINVRGAIIVIQESTVKGEPQYNIASSSEDYGKGFYTCRGTTDFESLATMLKQNKYTKIN